MMGFAQNYVASIIHNNKPLREFNVNGVRTCKIPYGAEYAIRLINRRKDQRAMVSVSIDGTEVLTGGKRVILNPNETIDLERFVDSLSEGRKFKFISIEEGIATGEIQDPSSPDNGTIEVLFYPEVPKQTILRGQSTNSMKKNLEIDWGLIRGATFDSMVMDGASYMVPQDFEIQANAGVTVEGSLSDQTFTIGQHFEVGAPVSIKIKLEAPSAIESFGVFIGNATKPLQTFNDKQSALDYLANNDFGGSSVTMKPIPYP